MMLQDGEMADVFLAEPVQQTLREWINKLIFAAPQGSTMISPSAVTGEGANDEPIPSDILLSCKHDLGIIEEMRVRTLTDLSRMANADGDEKGQGIVLKKAQKCFQASAECLGSFLTSDDFFCSNWGKIWWHIEETTRLCR